MGDDGESIGRDAVKEIRVLLERIRYYESIEDLNRDNELLSRSQGTSLMSPEGGRNQFFLVGDVEKTVEVVCPLCGEQIDCLYHCVETDRWTRVRWGEEGPQEEEKPVVDEILGEVYICPNCVSELFTDGDAAVAFLRGEELDRLIDVRLIPRPDTEPFPPFETIKRLRQKIQHIERSHLPTDPRVRRKRGISDEEYQHWIARSKRRGRGAKK